MIKKKNIATSTQREAADPKHSVWVTANAGSGKTHVLVERVVRLLLHGAEPTSILCITYTKAAAAEMSERLFKRLGSWTALQDDELSKELVELGVDVSEKYHLVAARRLFTRALETPGGLKIQTIHAFCEKLLHLFPVEAGLAPGFRVLDDRRERELRDEAIQHILQLVKHGANGEYEKAFSDVVAQTNSEGFAGLLREFLSGAKGLRSILAPDVRAQEFELALKETLNLDHDKNSRQIRAELENIDRSLYEHHAGILATHKPYYRFDAATLMVQAAKASEPFEHLSTLAFTKEKKVRDRKLYSEGFQKDHPDTAMFLDTEKQRWVECVQSHDLVLRVEATTSLFTLAKAIQEEIEKKKRQLGLCDFDDLINRTAKLLNSSGAALWVLYKLDAGLKHILVDEAQDTSPAQWQIIKALTDEFFSVPQHTQTHPRTVFAVGDRKQSIYSFQGADAAAFSQARHFFENIISSAQATFKNIDLSISYRSTEEILTAVDKVFPPNNPLRLGFPLDDRSEQPHQTNRMKEPGVVEVWPLYEALEKQEELPWKAPVDSEARESPRRRLAKDIATTIKGWIGKRVIAATNKPVKAEDILILLQSRGPLFSMLIAELRKANVPVAGADRLNLLESLAIQDMLVLAQWLQLPDDDYALSCILKSPLVPKPLNEDQLFELAHNRGSTSLWQRLQDNDKPTANLFIQWQKLVDELGPYDFFSQILLHCRKAMVARLGPEALDASDALLDQALSYEKEYGRSITGFIYWFTGSETSLKREMEKGTDQVRLMTVHGAKGLEAKIVFLPNAANLAGGNKSKAKLLRAPTGTKVPGLPLWKLSNLTISKTQQDWDDAETAKSTAERNRLLYVAMTRACDELYICGWKGEQNLSEDCWYRTVEDALGPRNENDQIRFGAPYAYQEAQPLEKTQKPQIENWLTTNAAPEQNVRVHSLTGLIAKRGSGARNYDPINAHRGIAIHSLLQELPDIVAEAREDFAIRKAKRFNLDQSEAISLAQLVNKPEFMQFFGPESSGEAEIRGCLADGRLVSGRVDRIAVFPNEIILLDFKSERIVPSSLDFDHPYVKQLSLYSEVLKNAYPDRMVKAAVLWTQSSKLEWISAALLQKGFDQAIAALEPDAP